MKKKQSLHHSRVSDGAFILLAKHKFSFCMENYIAPICVKKQRCITKANTPKKMVHTVFNERI